MINKKFMDVYVGATEVANLMGIHVDTLRKRAKAGKVPAQRDAKGRWVFVTSQLAKAGIEPFASGSTVAAVPVVKKLTDVIFVLDRSGSMSGLMRQAKENLQAQVDKIKSAAGPNDVYRISVINFDDTVSTTLRAMDVTAIGNTSHLYLNANGSTRLYDAVLTAVSMAQSLDTKDAQHAFLISIVTDGQENASSNSAHSVASAVQQATGLDRYTFAFAGPHGSQNVAGVMGVPAGNTTQWEQTTRGTQYLGVVTNSSLDSYTTSRSRGFAKSTSFYAAPVTKDADKFAGQLDKKLNDVSSQVQVKRVTDTDPVVIRNFCALKFGNYDKGSVYYQLTESEKVQDYKKLIIQDTATGNFYAGWDAAKKLLGLPDFQGTVKIRPGSLGEFKVFVQSTSVNRKLTPGTAVVYLP